MLELLSSSSSSRNPYHKHIVSALQVFTDADSIQQRRWKIGKPAKHCRNSNLTSLVLPNSPYYHNPPWRYKNCHHLHYALHCTLLSNTCSPEIRGHVKHYIVKDSLRFLKALVHVLSLVQNDWAVSGSRIFFCKILLVHFIPSVRSDFNSSLLPNVYLLFP